MFPINLSFYSPILLSLLGKNKAFFFSLFFCMYDPLVSSRHFKIGIMLTVVNYLLYIAPITIPRLN